MLPPAIDSDDDDDCGDRGLVVQQKSRKTIVTSNSIDVDSQCSPVDVFFNV
jgi:hypothetical protein